MNAREIPDPPNVTLDGPACPLCGGGMHPREVMNALSRYMNLTICSACGTVEALTLASLNSGAPNTRSCLYYDQVMGIGWVDETVSGYNPMWPKVDAAVAREYVLAVNHRHGIEPDDQSTIVYRSMFGGGQ